jgi:plasmid segregation protein ParM
LYNNVIERINAAYDILLTETDVDAVLKDTPNDCAEPLKQLIHEQAQTFVNNLFSKLRERMIDLRSGKTVFVGGGAILLRKQIESSGKVAAPVFVDNIAANAEGYLSLYRSTTKAGGGNG